MKKGYKMFSSIKKSSSNFSFANKDTNGSTSSRMALQSINEIKRGIQTDIMKKVGLVDPACCVSLCNEVRSLDLTFDSPEKRNYFIRAIQALVYPQEIFMS